MSYPLTTSRASLARPNAENASDWKDERSKWVNAISFIAEHACEDVQKEQVPLEFHPLVQMIQTTRERMHQQSKTLIAQKTLLTNHIEKIASLERELKDTTIQHQQEIALKDDTVLELKSTLDQKDLELEKALAKLSHVQSIQQGHAQEMDEKNALLKEALDEIETLQNQSSNEKLEQQRDEALALLEELQISFASVTEERDDLLHENTDLRSQIEDMAKELSQTESRIKALSKNLQTQFLAPTPTLDGMQVALEEENTHLRELCEDLRTQIEGLHLQLDHAKALGHSNLVDLEQYKSNFSDLEKRVVTLAKSEEDAMVLVGETEKEKDLLGKQLVDSQTVIKTSDAQNKELLVKIASLEQILLEAQQKEVRLKTKVKQMISANPMDSLNQEQLLVKCKELSNVNQEVKRELLDCRKNLTNLHKTHDDTLAHLTRMQNDQQELVQILQKKTEQLEQLQQRHATLDHLASHGKLYEEKYKTAKAEHERSLETYQRLFEKHQELLVENKKFSDVGHPTSLPSVYAEATALKGSLERLQKELGTKDNALLELKRDLRAALVEKEEAQRRIEQMEQVKGLLLDKDDQMDDLRREITKLNGECTQLRSFIDTHRGNYQSKDFEIANLKERMATIQQEASEHQETLEKHLHEVTETLAATVDDLEQKQQELDGMDEKHATEMQSRLTKKNTEIYSLQETIKRLTKRCHDLADDVSELESAWDSWCLEHSIESGWRREHQARWKTIQQTSVTTLQEQVERLKEELNRNKNISDRDLAKNHVALSEFLSIAIELDERHEQDLKKLKMKALESGQLFQVQDVSKDLARERSEKFKLQKDLNVMTEHFKSRGIPIPSSLSGRSTNSVTPGVAKLLTHVEDHVEKVTRTPQSD
jgi:chromosome segregation ATPase